MQKIEYGSGESFKAWIEYNQVIVDSLWNDVDSKELDGVMGSINKESMDLSVKKSFRKSLKNAEVVELSYGKVNNYG